MSALHERRHRPRHPRGKAVTALVADTLSTLSAILAWRPRRRNWRRAKPVPRRVDSPARVG